MVKSKGVFYVGVFTFISLLVLSAIYYKERIIFLDPAFQLSYMIRDGGFAIQVNRFAAVITKIFPYIALKLSLPLGSVVLIYSMSFVLVDFGIFIFILKVLKRIKWAFFLLLFNILMISHTFYWPAIELNQGIAMMILLFAFIRKKVVWYNKIILFLMAVLVPTVIFSHPLIVIPFVFLSVYLFIFNRENLNLNRYYFVIILAILSFFINKTFFRNWYDDMNMKRLSNFIELFPDYFNTESNKYFIKYLLEDYFISFVIFIVVSIYFILKKQTLKIIYFWSFVLGYIFLVNVSFPESVPRFFAESKYILLSIFIITPLVFDIIDSINFRFFLLSLILIVLIRLFHINKVHKLYTSRLDMFRDVLKKTEQFENKKLILYEDDFPKDTLIMSWASAYEFWMLSALESDDQRSLLIDESPDRFDSLLNRKDIFLEEWRVYKYNVFPKKYFKFNDTTSYVKYHFYIKK